MKKEEMTDSEKIAYNCRKATFLIEKKQSEALTAREQMELRLHLAGCYICRVYEQQSLMISEMVRNLFKTGKPPEIRLDDQYKEQLKQRIEKEMDKKG